MCRDEVFGDYYRPCGHFVMKYYSGVRIDCKSRYCKISPSHMTHGLNEPCECNKEIPDERRIQSMFHSKCDTCKGPELYRRTGRTM